MTTQTKLKTLFEERRECWLEENTTAQTEKVPYGDTEVNMSVGYSDGDWEKASRHTLGEMKEALNELEETYG